MYTINQVDLNTDASQTRQKKLSSASDMLITCLVPEGMWMSLTPLSLRDA